MQEMGVKVKWEDNSETNTAESAKGNGVLPLPSEPGIVRQRCRSAASSTEPAPVPKALNSPPRAETGTEEDLYMTPAQILKEECDDEANLQAKIKYAESLGEGVNEDGKRQGWYRDESRQNAPVYYYARNMVHAVKLRDDKKLATKQSTGNMAIKGNGVLSLPSDPGSVPEALDVGRGCGSAACSNESAPVPKAPKVATSDTRTGGQPNTPSACTEQTNSEDSEAREAKTTVEVAKEPETVEVADETQASAEKAVPKKPAEDQKINLLKEAKDHLCIYYAFIFYVTICFTYIIYICVCAICF